MKIRLTRRRRSLASLAVIGALALAACGSDTKVADTAPSLLPTTSVDIATPGSPGPSDADLPTTVASNPSVTTADSTADSTGDSAAGSTPDSGDKPSFVIGSADFPENQLLAEIYGQELVKAGYEVDYKPAIGSREVYYKAISASPPEITLVPEYTNSLLSYVIKLDNPDASPDATTIEEQADALKAALPDSLTIAAPSAAEDKDVIVCNKATADKYSLKTLSDLAGVSAEITLGAPAEFETRSPFGLEGFKSLYGATFKEFVPLKIGDIPAALKGGSIDCGNLFSTMSVITTDELVGLEDDKTIVAHEAVVPLIVKSALTPEVAKVLDSVSSKLDTETLKKLMVKIEVDKQAPDKVAEEFIATLG